MEFFEIGPAPPPLLKDRFGQTSKILCRSWMIYVYIQRAPSRSGCHPSLDLFSPTLLEKMTLLLCPHPLKFHHHLRPPHSSEVGWERRVRERMHRAARHPRPVQAQKTSSLALAEVTFHVQGWHSLVPTQCADQGLHAGLAVLSRETCRVWGKI